MEVGTSSPSPPLPAPQSITVTSPVSSDLNGERGVHYSVLYVLFELSSICLRGVSRLQQKGVLVISIDFDRIYLS